MAETAHRAIRVDEDLWNRFGDAAGAVGSDRTKVLVGFMRRFADAMDARLAAGGRPGRDQRPDVPLRLTPTGPGSRASIVDYVRTVLEQREALTDDDPGRVARAIVTSVLSRLGAGYSVATAGVPDRLADTDQGGGLPPSAP